MTHDAGYTSILGHERIVEDLMRLADRGALAHSYLFFGPERVGKRTVAIHLANYLETGALAPPSGPPLGDVYLIEPDENGTIGIDAVREVRHFLFTRPNRSAYRTVIVDESDALTDEAQNALLKVTEEPPASALLILVVRHPELLRPTLASRLEKLYFGIVSRAKIAEWLQKEFSVSAKEAGDIARRSFGEPGRAAALLNDEQFQALREAAQRFLRVPPARRREFVKKLVEPDDFNFKKFLDATIDVVGEESRKEEYAALWHRLLELRRQISFSPLNPRLQLLSLFPS